MRTSSIFIFAVLMLLNTLTGQSLTIPADLTAEPINTQTGFPFNTLNDQRWQWHIDSSNFTGAGGSMVINELSVRLFDGSFTLPNFSYNSVEITLAEASTDYLNSSHSIVFAQNFTSNTKLVRSGPFVGGPLPAPGGSDGLVIALELQDVFVYDPTTGNDLIIDIKVCGVNASFGSPLAGRLDSAGPLRGSRFGHRSDCSATLEDFRNLNFLPFLKIDYLPALFQPNTAKAHLDHNGIATNALTPGVTNVGSGETIVADFHTTLLGAPSEFAIALGAPIPGTDPAALTLPSGQMLNLDLASPTTTFIWGGLTPNFRPAFDFLLPFTAGVGPFQWTSQGVILDFSSPSFFTLTSASSVRIRQPGVDITAAATGLNSFNSETNSGFWSITNTSNNTNIQEVILDFQNSTNPGQFGTFFDTDQTGMADIFAAGNSTAPSCAGTYRLSSDIACGLMFDAQNTPSPLTCTIPNAPTGWFGSNAANLGANSYRTLGFRFNGFTPGRTFEFDCDTDAGVAGPSGAGMAGIKVTVVTDNAGTLTGHLQIDPNQADRSFIRWQ